MLSFLPFETLGLNLPKGNEHWIAAGLSSAPIELQEYLTILQPFRPHYLSLQKTGFQIVTHFEAQNNADGALLVLGRHKKQNEANLANLLARVKVGCPIIIAGERINGADSFLKKTKSLFKIENQYSKNHGRIFYFLRPKEIVNIIAELTPKSEIFEGFETQAGMFSHGRIDEGSALLTKHFADRIYGQIADLGAGWGYLSAHILKKGKKLSGVDLYEADYNALEAAKQNLKAYQGDIPLSFHWHDILSEPVDGIYDTVVLNPPFHEEHKAEPNIGQHFIEASAKRLKRGGRMLMVANRNLPYEATLKQHFFKLNKLEETSNYKVFEAIKK